jgi:uncharacterized protein YkwD
MSSTSQFSGDSQSNRLALSERLSQSISPTSQFALADNLDSDRTLHASSLQAMSDPGNTLATASRMGPLTATPTRLVDSVGPGDRNDYYQFSLSQQISFNLALSGLQADANVRLLRADGTLISRSNRTGTANEAINRTLDAGTYYIRVHSATNTTAFTPYTLAVSATSTAPPPPPDTAFVQRVLELTNQFRSQNGLTLLTLNVELNAASLGHSRDMALQDFFSHTGRDGSAPWDRAREVGYEARTMAENIAAGYSTPEQVVQGWINSAGHRANLLNASFRELGVGYFFLSNDTGSVNYRHYWTQMFGSGDLNPSSNLSAASSLTLASANLDLSGLLDTKAIGSEPAIASATTMPLVTPDPGSTFATAYDVGTLGSTPITLSDGVNSSDRLDIYRLSLSATSTLTLTLDELSGNAGLQLFTASGSLLNSRTNSSVPQEVISRTLGAGTYYVRVSQSIGTTDYRLTFSTTSTTPTPIPDPQPPTPNPQPPTPNPIPSGFNSNYGFGLVNAAAAVAKALNQPTFAAVPNLGGNSWNLDLINAPEVWARGYTGQGIVVAVIDTGVDYSHPDLDANIWTNNREIAGNGVDDDRNGFVDDVRGWDFVDRDNTPTDPNGHGTHVAGTIAAENNGVGATGVAYNARIMPVRVLNSGGSGSTSTIAAGVRYAADNGADVITLSLGGGLTSDLQSAIQYAAQQGATVVMAAGNSGSSQPGFPARLANQVGIAVGAVDRNNRMAGFSNRAGSSPLNYVVAPGVAIFSTRPNNTFANLNGTSMATPHVAGVAALMLNAAPNLTPAQVVNLLTTTANPQGVTV